MKIKTSELTDLALDWAVAKCLGLEEETLNPITWVDTAYPSRCYDYSTDWSQGGPIIEREHINLSAYQLPEEGWQAWPNYGMSDWWSEGPTPLIAAMRCYVASKLGDEVEIPDVLVC